MQPDRDKGLGVWGIGTDVVDIARIEQTWQRHPERFVNRILGAQEKLLFERRLARSHARGMAFLATRFSAKESFSKAIGLGMRQPMAWRHCQILPMASGEPQIVLDGELAQWFEQQGLHAQVSVSDERQVAISMVVVEKKEVR